MQTIHILQVEDNVAHRKQFRTLAWRLGNKQNLEVIVTSFDNLKEGYAELEKNISKYKALVLDAKCIIDKGENESFEFLPKALRELTEINRKTGQIHLPFAINTGYYGYNEVKIFMREIAEQGGQLFDKSDEENMLAFLFAEIAKLENTKIEKQYANVFELFELGFMPPNPTDCRQKLLKILKNIDNPAENIAILQDARVIQDEIYKILQQSKINGLSRSFSFMEKNKFLSGNEDFVDSNDKRKGKQPTTTVYQTPALSYLASNVNQICSAFGNHSTTRPENVEVKYWEVPSNYAVKSVVFALLEQLLWFKELMKTN